MLIDFVRVLIWAWFAEPQNKCCSNTEDSPITGHRHKCNYAKEFEILRELPNCDTETQSEVMLLEKRCQQTCLIEDRHKPLVKAAVSVKLRR